MNLGLSQYIPFLIYLLGIIVIFITIFRSTNAGILYIAFLLPLTSLLKKMYEFPLGKDIYDLMILALLIGWLIQRSNVRDRVVESSRFNKPLLALLFYTYFSLWIGTLYYSDAMPVTKDNLRLLTWKEYITIFILFWLVFNNIKTREQIVLVILVMALSMLIVNFKFHSEFQWLEKYHYTDNMRKIKGTFSYLGANHLGSFFSQYGMFLLGIFLYEKKFSPKNIFLFVVLAWSFNSVLYTYSRGAYIGTFLAVIFVLFLKNKKFLVLPVLLLVFWTALLPQSVIDRIQMTQTEEGELDTSTQARLALWDEALEMVKKNPVTGLGFDTFAHGDAHFEGLKDTHNIYLKTLAEQGIIGLALLLYLFYLGLRRSWRLFRTSDDGFLKGLGLGGVGAVVSCMVTNLFGDRWSFLMLTGYFWIFMALIERANVIVAEKLQTSASER